MAVRTPHDHGLLSAGEVRILFEVEQFQLGTGAQGTTVNPPQGSGRRSFLGPVGIVPPHGDVPVAVVFDSQLGVVARERWQRLSCTCGQMPERTAHQSKTAILSG